MNNFKVMMNGIIKENPTFVLLRYVSYIGYDFVGHQWYGYGTGYHVRFDLLECGDLFNQEPDSGYGAYPVVYRGDRIFRNLASNGDAGIRAGTVRYARTFHPVDCSELYCVGTCRSIRRQE